MSLPNIEHEGLTETQREKIQARLDYIKDRWHDEVQRHPRDCMKVGRLEGNIGALEWVLREIARKP